jgi:hypothetical protein
VGVTVVVLLPGGGSLALFSATKQKEGLCCSAAWRWGAVFCHQERGGGDFVVLVLEDREWHCFTVMVLLDPAIVLLLPGKGLLPE